MKVNITKVASVLMVVALLAATGCSKPNSDGTSSPAASSKPSVSESSKEALTPMTIRFAAGDNNPTLGRHAERSRQTHYTKNRHLH